MEIVKYRNITNNVINMHIITTQLHKPTIIIADLSTRSDIGNPN